MTNQQPVGSSRAATPESSFVYFVFACIAAVAVLGMPIYQDLSVGSGASYSCIMGPVPPGAVYIGEVGPVDSYKTVFPAGRYCEWANAAGEPLAYQTGWITTIVACVATAVVVWMTALAVREKRPRRLRITLIPPVLSLLAWIAVFL
ncbi:hypothetical protein [Microbacterium phyllosphaerae]|uniref:hypothetical protein n=1 Tax=Microbacterium phyllosphaerae TaxID=124798 RepID=UPI00216A4991|nr:hypothetical protein [Microbacterium phyllosphaerae]MCS3442157.1 hypothetical protein [Microbacterium phyllosphaerae]